MATLKDLNTQLERMKEAITQELPGIVTTVVVTAKALAEREIKENGFGATYSRGKYPAFFLYGKQLNQKGESFLKAHGVNTEGKQTDKVQKGKKDTKRALTYAERLTNWAEFREAQGLQVEHVDLSYSNKMFANMGPGEPEISGTKVTVLLGATNQEAQKKMNYNFIRYGNFIQKALISEKQQQLLREVMRREILTILNPFRT